ncbi:MAG: carbon-nitrogen hydrolase family protein [Sedimentisphaerales bacterium]|nr:carbon-nitrogen hydrolase family protein [Sedimentisphaerales bacterium]
MYKMKKAAFRLIVTSIVVIAAQIFPDATAGQETDNLITNGDFSQGEIGKLPQGWETVTPNPALAPSFELVKDNNGKNLLQAQGNGRQECFGYVRFPLKLPKNTTFKMQVRFRTENLEDVNRHLAHGVFGDFNDGIFCYRRDAGWIVGENRFAGAGGNCEIRLYFRFSGRGKVWWDNVSLSECEPIPPRPVKVAVSWGRHDMNFWSEWLDKVGSKKVDIALLPEVFNNKEVDQAEPINGPAAKLMANKAKQWKMYLSGSFYEKRGDFVYNTAPFFDRQGKLLGTYEKLQLYDPELDRGATSGRRSPVFQTDFGKVGIIICYDSWFPETTRLLGYKGAELILFPNAGYYLSLMPARAADNGVWIAASSLGNQAGIWDSGGARAGAPNQDPTRNCPTSITEYAKDEANCLILATVDLSQHWSPHWWGGPMRSAPATRRVRQTTMKLLTDEISREEKRWVDD